MTHEIEALLQPISAEAPCGENLEDTQLLTAFDAYRLFGMLEPPKETKWRVMQDHAFESLTKSHDLRLLAYLAAATVRIDGLLPFCTILTVADRWLGEYWELVFPRVDEDALLRKNALNCFADRVAIVDALRRTPIVAHRQLGAVCLRDWELATGQITATADDAVVPNSAQIDATFASTSAEELAALAGRLSAGISSLRNIVATMQTRVSFESSPDFDPVLKPLSQIEQLIKQHSPALAEIGAASGDNAEVGGAVAMGNIKSRQDAIRAIDAATVFFRQNEPSSPVPLLLDRAKRLVAKSFMEVLEDIAPDSLTQAKLVGGIKGDEGQSGS
jgi:type VI secretion system protein ImpA